MDSLDDIQHAHIEALHHAEGMSPKTLHPRPFPAHSHSHHVQGIAEPPLSGIKVVIIHIKDTMKDGPHVRDNVLAQLNDYEQALQQQGQGLGCEFVISRRGESYWF